ncbi:cobyrinic acid a,c-diamide synthase [Paenibacillus apiarius]|uniref:cobyrinic acid a,c-diamide synthase n=1 Tax=Paenibacillus apiarius TaxID=46240 RepID=UPI00197DDDC3|nr:cobyrinic acid a,c-diamide synthase [Paenibacillus apiarius]MBN3526677.1 cobyrinic acid a,c-diamide synthase [Paenibacillus apiarius]
MSLPRKPVSKERLSDDELERFVRCRRCYFRKCRNSHESSWIYAAQASVDKIVHAYYARAPETRTPASVIQDIERHWTQERERFQSEQHYVRIKRSVSYNLSEHLTGESSGQPLLLLGETLTVQAAELGATLSMTMQMAECSDASFVIRKYVIADEPQVFKAYIHLAIVFAYEAFQRLPEKIEVCSLLNGAAYAVHPQAEHYRSSVDFLRLMLGVMSEGPLSSNFYH